MENLLKKLPFYDKTWFNFLRFLIRNFIEDDSQQKAASLTYTTLLSIVPILTVLLMILSSIPALESVREQISDLIYSNLLPQSGLQVSQYLNDFAEKSSNLTAIGAMALFVTSIMTLTTIERAFNQIWRVEDRSGGVKSIVRYWTIITLGPLVLGTAFIVSSTVQSLSFLNQQIGGYGIDWNFWIQLVSFAITIAGFIGMYWFIPKAKVPLKNAAIAGVFVAVTFELLKYSFGIVMTNFTSYEAIYGAFAALPIFLLWIYLSWNIILLGVEISYTLTIFATKEVYPRHPLLSLLDMLNLIHDRYQEGQSTSEEELRSVLGRKELPKWFTYLNYLLDSNLITVTEKGNYVLKRDLDHITLWDFYRTLPYPLPIKDELDEVSDNMDTPWLNLLVDRFKNTENHAKNELDIPLGSIFEHSLPREGVETTEPMFADSGEKAKSKNQGKLNSVKGDFEAETFDPDAKVVEDNKRNEAVMPPEGDLAPNSSVKSTSSTETEKPKKRSGLLGMFSHDKDAPVITEEDNPDR
ncbi:YihY family inner membrane protein [Psychrobacter sanguinis]|uniref:YihY family inner membrane protein n=1 Tax=Psychrobacter sanguinis TaxID=861445 RepID=UPI0028B18DA8|nr:YihY family inner membrane protein [Psychrobacter sanguinis]